MKITVLVGIFFLSSGGFLAAQEVETLSDLIVQHEITLPEAGQEARLECGIYLVIDLHEGKAGGLIDRNVMEAMIRQQFLESGMSLRAYSGDFRTDLFRRRIGLHALISPKLVVEVSVSPDDRSAGYEVTCYLTYFEYETPNGRSRQIRAKRTWAERRVIQGITKDSLDDNLDDFIQEALGKFLKTKESRKKVGTKPRLLKESQRKEGSVATSSSLSYSLKWNDPDNRRNHFFIGGTAGTPALANINIGFWGSQALPLVFGISGMYYSNATRGVQVDASWAIINSGSLRHAMGIALAAVNETTTNTSYVTDVFNRVTQTNIETVDTLRPYAGPVYTLDWKSFRLQAGAGFRLQSDSSTGVRALFQLGYTPPLDF